MTVQKHRFIPTYFTRLFALFFLVAGLSAAPALGQSDGDKQEYKRAYNAGREAAQNKDYQKAYQEFSRAAELAEQAGDQQVARSASKVVSQLDYNFGLQAMKNEEVEQAVEHFNSGIQTFPSFANNYWGKAQALKKLDRTDEAIATYEQALSTGQEQGNETLANKAKAKIRDHYVYLASQALSSENVTSTAADEALNHLSALEEYEVEPDAAVYFYRAVAENAKGNLQEAVNLANQALEISRGSRTDKAKIYFLKGEALMKLGNENEALSAFQNAAYGSYKQPAEHYIEQLSS